jgi:hypothetical protein
MPPPALSSDSEADRRRHRRVPVRLEARYLTPDGAERGGVVTDLSAGGARLATTSTAAALGDRVVAYVGRLGRVEGEVVRRDAEGFALRFEQKRARAKRLADALTFIVNSLESRDKRRARRYAQDAPAGMVLPDGEVLQARVLDVSTTGASIATAVRPPIGTTVTLGRMRAQVVRHHEDGVGVLFARQAGGTAEAVAQAGARVE